MRPIFIGGGGRSGTTFLASMLGAAAGTVVTPESQFKTEIGRFQPVRGFDGARALTAVERAWRFKIWQLALADDDRRQAAGLVSWPELLAFVVDRYAAAHGRDGASVWIDHTPENITFVPLLARWFPDARFVHIVRDGRALLASVKKLDWNMHGPTAGGRWWGFLIGQGLAAENYLPPDHITRVHYETLVEEPEPTLRRLCARLQLDYTPEMLAGDGFLVPGYTRRQHRRVGRPPDPARLQAWRDELAPREIERFEAATFELLHMLGYPSLYGAAARPASRIERLCDLAARSLGEINFHRSWRRLSGPRRRAAADGR